ncbi:unnamed protein product [Amoebophrya sp. A25]|nr:unnamed protein product [Amoebophrya sp. A25]|eukprot:GSA25T00000066001.1
MTKVPASASVAARTQRVLHDRAAKKAARDFPPPPKRQRSPRKKIDFSFRKKLSERAQCIIDDPANEHLYAQQRPTPRDRSAYNHDRKTETHFALLLGAPSPTLLEEDLVDDAGDVASTIGNREGRGKGNDEVNKRHLFGGKRVGGAHVTATSSSTTRGGRAKDADKNVDSINARTDRNCVDQERGDRQCDEEGEKHLDEGEGTAKTPEKAFSAEVDRLVDEIVASPSHQAARRRLRGENEDELERLIAEDSDPPSSPEQSPSGAGENQKNTADNVLNTPTTSSAGSPKKSFMSGTGLVPPLDLAASMAAARADVQRSYEQASARRRRAFMAQELNKVEHDVVPPNAPGSPFRRARPIAGVNTEHPAYWRRSSKKGGVVGNKTANSNATGGGTAGTTGGGTTTTVKGILGEQAQFGTTTENVVTTSPTHNAVQNNADEGAGFTAHNTSAKNFVFLGSVNPGYPRPRKVTKMPKKMKIPLGDGTYFGKRKRFKMPFNVEYRTFDEYARFREDRFLDAQELFLYDPAGDHDEESYSAATGRTRCGVEDGVEGVVVDENTPPTTGVPISGGAQGNVVHKSAVAATAITSAAAAPPAPGGGMKNNVTATSTPKFLGEPSESIEQQEMRRKRLFDVAHPNARERAPTKFELWKEPTILQLRGFIAPRRPHGALSQFGRAVVWTFRNNGVRGGETQILTDAGGRDDIGVVVDDLRLSSKDAKASPTTLVSLPFLSAKSMGFGAAGVGGDTVNTTSKKANYKTADVESAFRKKIKGKNYANAGGGAASINKTSATSTTGSAMRGVVPG